MSKNSMYEYVLMLSTHNYSLQVIDMIIHERVIDSPVDVVFNCRSVITSDDVILDLSGIINFEIPKAVGEVHFGFNYSDITSIFLDVDTRNVMRDYPEFTTKVCNSLPRCTKLKVESGKVNFRENFKDLGVLEYIETIALSYNYDKGILYFPLHKLPKFSLLILNSSSMITRENQFIYDAYFLNKFKDKIVLDDAFGGSRKITYSAIKKENIKNWYFKERLKELTNERT